MTEELERAIAELREARQQAAEVGRRVEWETKKYETAREREMRAERAVQGQIAALTAPPIAPLTRLNPIS